VIILPTKKKGITFSLEKIRLLLYGYPKIGKSTFCSSFPDALFLATEKRHESLDIFKTDITCWEDFKEASLLLEKDNKFKTVIIDTIDNLYLFAKEAICKQLKLIHISDGKFAKGYDSLKIEMDKYLNKLFFSNKGIILISHLKDAEIITITGKSTKAVSTLTGHARSIILPKVDCIGCMKIIHTQEKDINNNKIKMIEKRVISFKPSIFEEVGDTTGFLPEEIISYKDVNKTYSILKQSLKKGGDNIK